MVKLFCLLLLIFFPSTNAFDDLQGFEAAYAHLLGLLQKNDTDMRTLQEPLDSVIEMLQDAIGPKSAFVDLLPKHHLEHVRKTWPQVHNLQKEFRDRVKECSDQSQPDQLEECNKDLKGRINVILSHLQTVLSPLATGLDGEINEMDGEEEQGNPMDYYDDGVPDDSVFEPVKILGSKPFPPNRHADDEF